MPFFIVFSQKIFQSPTVTTIANWTVVCAVIGAIIMMLCYLAGGKKEQGMSLAHYGLTRGVVNIIAALCIAIIVTVANTAIYFQA